MQHPGHSLLVLLTGSAGHEDIGPYGKPDEQTDHEEDDRAVSAYRGQGIAAREPAHHSRIRGIKKLLQQAAGRDGQGKEDQLARQGAVQHIDFPLERHAIHTSIRIAFRAADNHRSVQRTDGFIIQERAVPSRGRERTLRAGMMHGKPSMERCITEELRFD